MIILFKSFYRLIKQWYRQESMKYHFLHEHKVKIEGGVLINKETKIGFYSFIGSGSIIGPSAKSIGKFCSIGAGSIIGPNSHDISKVTTSAIPFATATAKEFLGQKKNSQNESYRYKKAKLNQHKAVLGDDVWLGHNAVIMPGVCIGTGAVIGAGSIVTKDVPPYSIFAGVPAKLIRMRFSESTITTLLECKLYEYNTEQLLVLFNTYADRDLEAILPNFLLDLRKLSTQNIYETHI